MRLHAQQHPGQRALVLDANCTELSRACRRMLNMGSSLITMARQTSFWLIRADGVDQAKFRVPRCTTKTQSFDKLVCPALHVQGAWCEGFGYHFAVADADLNKTPTITSKWPLA